jgi:hypothetical protein
VRTSISACKSDNLLVETETVDAGNIYYQGKKMLSSVLFSEPQKNRLKCKVVPVLN